MSKSLVPMAEPRNHQFTAYLSPELAKRLNVCARYSGKAADTIVSDLVAACMEDLPTVENEGAEGVEKLLQLLQQGNVQGYEKARRLLDDIIERETMGAVVEAREARGLQRLQPPQCRCGNLFYGNPCQLHGEGGKSNH